MSSTIQGKEELFDENGSIPIWGKVSASGKPYYYFQLTNEDKYIIFPQVQQNPKAPKFVLKKTQGDKYKKGE